MSDRDGKPIVSRPAGELARIRPGAGAILDRMIDDAADIARRRDAARDGTGGHVSEGPAHRNTVGTSEADAQFHLGVMYHYGEGVPQDYGEATRWYWLAAQQDHPDAQYALGDMSTSERAFRKTMPKRYGGIDSPPSKTTPTLSSASGACTSTARGYHRTTPRR